MSIEHSIFRSSRENWKNFHKVNTSSFSFCSTKKYATLFAQYIKHTNEHPEAESFINLYHTIFTKKNNSLLKRLRGSCYGITMALIDYQLKNPSCLIEELFNPQNIVNIAVFYSLVDIIRSRIEFTKKQELTEDSPEYQKQINYFATFKKKTVKTSLDTLEFNQTLQQILTGLDGSVILLRIWHTLSFTQTLGHNDLKWIAPHSIFICLNPNQKLFYFYDIALKAIVKADTLDSFIEIFIDYIKNTQSDYLTPEIVWRFESKQFS